MLDDDWILLNPRLPDYQDSMENARRQIEWKYAHLTAADAVLFWFPKETLCPVALLDPGRRSGAARPIFIDIDPDCARRMDVEVQVGLATPHVRPVYGLGEVG